MKEQYTISEIAELFSLQQLQENAINLNKLERRSSYPDFDVFIIRQFDYK